MKHLAFVAFALLAVLLGAGRARAPSALPDFDRSALEEVRGSAYAPAISRCGVVPSQYLLHVETGY